MGGGGPVPALHVDPVAPGLFPVLNGPSAAPVTVTHAPVPAEGVGGKGGASGRVEGQAARVPKVSKRDTPFRRRVSDQFGNAFRAVFEVGYPWVFVGRDSDYGKVSVWIEAAKIREADPEPGLQRLYGAALAYCRAVDAGAVFPFDEAANTARFTKGITTWLQRDPDARPARGGKVDPNEATREAMRRAVERLEEMEAAK